LHFWKKWWLWYIISFGMDVLKKGHTDSGWDDFWEDFFNPMNGPHD